MHRTLTERKAQRKTNPGTAEMKMPPMPFTVTSWSGVPPTVRLDETGQATWRTFTIGDLRVCLVEYTAGYRADHWCDLARSMHD